MPATLTVSLIVVSRGDASRLPACLAAAARQSYPTGLVQVVVVSDGRRDVPSGELDVVVVDAPGGRPRHGLLRNRGAEASDGDVLLFLEDSMQLEPLAVEAHLRWHHAAGDVVTIGAHELPDVHEDRSDAFPPVVPLANVGVSGAIFHYAGGFAGHRLAAVEQVEFGYRLYNTGCVFVPVPQAAQGRGNVATRRSVRGAEAATQLASLVPLPDVRSSVPGRTYMVPRTLVHVPVTDEPYPQVASAAEAVLGGFDHDLVVRIAVSPSYPDHGRLFDHFRGDPRAEVVVASRPTWQPTPAAYQVWAPPTALLGYRSIDRLVGSLRGGGAGLIRLEAPGAPRDGPFVEAVTSRAAARALRLARGTDPRPLIRELFAERTHDAGAFDVRSFPTQGSDAASAVPVPPPADRTGLEALLAEMQHRRLDAERRIEDLQRSNQDLRRRLRKEQEEHRHHTAHLGQQVQTLQDQLSSTTPPSSAGLVSRAQRLLRSPSRAPGVVAARLRRLRRSGTR